MQIKSFNQNRLKMFSNIVSPKQIVSDEDSQITSMTANNVKIRKNRNSSFGPLTCKQHNNLVN